MRQKKKKKSKGFLVGDMVGKGGIWSPLKSFHFQASTDVCPCRWWEKTSWRGYQRADLHGISSDFQAQTGKLTNIPRGRTVTLPNLQKRKIHQQRLGATPRPLIWKVAKLALERQAEWLQNHWRLERSLASPSRRLVARSLALAQRRRAKIT